MRINASALASAVALKASLMRDSEAQRAQKPVAAWHVSSQID
jgi:hypothetical protein